MPCNGNPDRGSVLVVAMIAIGVLTAIIGSSLQRSTVDTSLAGIWDRRSRAAEAADSGLRLVARQVADEFGRSGSINSLLGTVQFGTSGGGQYGVVVADNDNVGGVDQDGDGSGATDADRAFRLVATGEVGNSEQSIEAFFRIQTSGTPRPGSDGIGALGLCANNTDISRAANISGRDYGLPPYPCSGAGCNSSPAGKPDAAGISYNTGTTVDYTGGTPGGTPSINSNAGIDCDGWMSFMTATAGVAQTTLPASAGPFNGADLTSAFGTATQPKIVVITGTSGEKAQFNGNLYGNGILIIRNAEVVFNGTFTYAGLIIIEDEGGGISFGGTSQILGSIMVLSATSADKQTEIDIKSEGTVLRYSTEGLAKADQALQDAGGSSARLEVLAWRTFSL
jgi:hypothetical protein